MSTFTSALVALTLAASFGGKALVRNSPAKWLASSRAALLITAPFAAPGCYPSGTSVGSVIADNTRAGTASMNASGATLTCQANEIRVADLGAFFDVGADRLRLPLPAGKVPTTWGVSLEFRPTPSGTLHDATGRGLWGMNEGAASTSANSAAVYTLGGHLYAWVRDGANLQRLVDCTAVQSGKNDNFPRQIMVTGGASQLSLYIDGEPCGTKSGSGTATLSLPAYATLGSRHDPATVDSPAYGTIRNVQMWTGATAPAASRFVKYAAIGDSITNGGAAALKTPYPDAVTRDLGPSRVLHNGGIGGYTTTQCLSRWQTVFKGKGYSAVAVLAGVNDLATDVASATTQANLTQIWSEAAAEGMQVVVMTVAPWKNSVSWTAARQTNTAALNAWIRAQATANNYQLIDAYALLGDSVDPAQLPSVWDSGDHIHPNQAGSDVLAAAVRQALP